MRDLRPWEQQSGEPPQWFEWFCRYRDLGPARSVDKAWRQHTRQRPGSRKRATRTWFTASKRWSWVERAVEWDRHLELQRTEARETEAAASAAEFERRWLRLQDRLMSTIEQSIDRVETMLRMPLVRQQVVEESVTVGNRTVPTRTTVVMPAGWSMSDARGFMSEARRLGEFLVESRHEHERGASAEEGGRAAKVVAVSVKPMRDENA